MLSHFSRYFCLVVVVVAAQLAPSLSVASTLTTYWMQGQSSRYSSPDLACKAKYPSAHAIAVTAELACYVKSTPTDPGYTYVGTVLSGTQNCQFGDNGTQCNASCDSPKVMIGGQCVSPAVCIGESVLNPATNSCDLTCTPPKTPNSQTMTCELIPPQQCSDGATWDWDNNRCSYPQDDACGSVGAQWDPQSQQCQCSSGKVLAGSAEMMRCVDQAPDQECTEGSSDFSGYINNTAICAGRNRCPDGGKPGFVGTGDDVKAVCMGGQDPNCPEGQTGGVMNGKHYCVSDPDDGHDPRCALNETPGYVGAGPNAEFTCVPDSYLPETCPPGQYVWNTGTGGFGCVTSGGEPPKTDSNGDPVKPGTVTGTIGGSEGEGGEPGEEGEPIELDFGALIEEAPKDNFQKDLEEYGQEKIDGIDIDSLIGEFDGPDGAFTERSSLDALSDFVIQHTVGSSVNCSGSMPFFGMSIGCDKMERAHRIWRWIIFVGTLIYIFKTLTRPSASGV